MRSGVVSLIFILLAVMSGAGVFAAETAPVSADATSAPPATPTYQIGVDDMVQVSVWHNPDLSVTVPVRPDGNISVPLIGDVRAGGRAPQDVAADVKQKLATYLRDPQVAVILTELRSHEYLSRVRVTGAVHQPVSIPYRPGMTVLDAVLAAGGTTEFAAGDRTFLYRREQDGSVKPFDVKLDKIMKKGELSSNIAVQAGDIITVPERAF